MQLDLFTHGRDVMLQNDVIAQLRKRDPTAGRQTCAALKAEFPAHDILAPLNILLDTLIAPVQRLLDHDSAAGKVHEIDTVVAPAANKVFGNSDVENWLSPVWRTLAESAAALPFNPATPEAHAAYLLLRSGDHAAAETSVTGIPSWRRIPTPLAWMAQARFYQSGLDAAWPLLIELAWIDARAFSALAHRLQAPSLHKLLKDFNLAFDDDNTPDRAWFPAWLLITAPAMAAVMRETQTCNNATPERVARLIMELLALEKQGRHAILVAQRKKLRNLHATLYGIYMASR
jgi:hypothetical protein